MSEVARAFAAQNERIKMSHDAQLPTSDEVYESVARRVFGAQLIQNNLRGEVAETIVGLALGDGWSHCARDWAGWDFEKTNPACTTPCRIQVRQSAARQSWHEPRPAAAHVGSYDITPKSGFYRGTAWTELQGRHAEIFVFAWHGVETPDADHRNPSQWSFFVVAEGQLPAQKQIGLAALRKLATAIDFAGLRAAVEACIERLQR